MREHVDRTTTFFFPTLLLFQAPFFIVTWCVFREVKTGPSADRGLLLLLLFSVTQLCLTLCDAMDCSTPGLLCFIISRSLLTLMSIELVMPSNHLTLCYALLLLLQSLPASRSFPMSQLFASGGRSIGASASASVLPMNIQD